MLSSTPNVRFNVTLCVACTFAVVQLILSLFLRFSVSWYNPIAWIFTLYILLLQHTGSFKWNRLFGGHLSRQQRTLFDEWNVMETYQPRAWTMGYLFDPEPPTPYCDGKPSEQTDQFKAMRDAHYANEYTVVQKMEAERKAMEESNKTSNPSKSQQTTSTGEPEAMRIELNPEPKDDQDSYREI
ncbi:unnamed protein product [Cylicocyclus nassatus]|uniref:Uncharacterized protein n=1 Tax=Cylicocyclus nassatus TaxID=53992 RepID=A0AA36GXP7_CYLNA|nr:unnamed protein product [Cylicocyclus nassatus]